MRDLFHLIDVTSNLIQGVIIQLRAQHIHVTHSYPVQLYVDYV